MTRVTELGDGLYRISTHVPPLDLQFNQFLVDDREPLLFHTGLRTLFPSVRDAVGSVLDPSRLRWIAFSHFEADECGALDEWLELAPGAEPLCSSVAKAVSIDDVASRPARELAHREELDLGSHRLLFLQTPQVPHAWDAGLLFDLSTRALLCSDLGHHTGDREPVTDADIVARMREALLGFAGSPFARYLPWTPYTEPTLRHLAELEPRMLATMHGSTFVGDGGDALRRMAVMLRETLAGDTAPPA